jgi:hypothetical protein
MDPDIALQQQREGRFLTPSRERVTTAKIAPLWIVVLAAKSLS